ncbi:hypothetical protein [Streptomyces caniscabiei]|uniref:hypothetical protein n=1 Tax=Streptomyces caniscabiei TaxID=2746961 RepID=UPI000765C652|nr:hypothetical protein [Streptomyces caniscabiei]
MSRAPRGPRRARATTLALALLSAAALLSTTACSSESGDDRRPGRSAERTPAKANEAGGGREGRDSLDDDAPRELAYRAPDPVTDGVVLRQNRTRGSAHLEFRAARKGEGGALSVTVSCEGKGTIEVVLRPMGSSFPMECLDDEVTSISNEFAVDDAERAGTVSVTATSGVQWSLSMGRGEPTEQEFSG